MTAPIALVGLGRMGKLALRALADRGLADRIAFVADRDGDAASHAHLIEFDSVHGRWDGAAAADGALLLRGARIPFVKAARIEDLPLSGVGLVIDCTGAFKTAAKIEPWFDGGARTVLVSAPVKEGGALNIVYGVNHTLYDPALHRVVTAASCTTNCLAPVVQVIHERFGIRHGSITTIHDVTNTQVIVDRWHKDPRRARSALNALIPTTTGSARAIGMIFPELEGKLDGHAVRAPILNGSLTDCVFELARETTAEEINAALTAAAEGPLKGVLGVETRPLVSTDFVNDPRSSIVDAPSTLVTGDTQAKIYAWYDNEWGYVQRMADIAQMILGAGRSGAGR